MLSHTLLQAAALHARPAWRACSLSPSAARLPRPDVLPNEPPGRRHARPGMDEEVEALQAQGEALPPDMQVWAALVPETLPGRRDGEPAPGAGSGAGPSMRARGAPLGCPQSCGRTVVLPATKHPPACLRCRLPPHKNGAAAVCGRHAAHPSDWHDRCGSQAFRWLAPTAASSKKERIRAPSPRPHAPVGWHPTPAVREERSPLGDAVCWQVRGCYRPLPAASGRASCQASMHSSSSACVGPMPPPAFLHTAAGLPGAAPGGPRGARGPPAVRLWGDAV